MSETVVPAERITDAWGKLFSGHGHREDAAIVLAELKFVSGFYMATFANTPDGARAFAEGRRSIYLHLLSQIEKSEAATAVEREARLYRV